MATTPGEITIKAGIDPKVVRDLSEMLESSHRRKLVGGLIRYLKDGETDLGRLLFHYVHAEDYGKAMVEGWGELHKLLTEPSMTIGPFGLPYRDFDFWEQAVMGTVLDDAMESGIGIPDPAPIRERIIEAGKRVKAYRGGNILRDGESKRIEAMVIGFAAAGGLEDLIQPIEEEPDWEPDEACDPAD